MEYRKLKRKSLRVRTEKEEEEGGRKMSRTEEKCEALL